MYAATVLHRRWLWPVKFPLEVFREAVALRDGTPGTSHIPTRTSYQLQGEGPGI
jgi:hypothetical protein